MGRRSKTSALGSAKSWVEWKAELFEAIEQFKIERRDNTMWVKRLR